MNEADRRTAEYVTQVFQKYQWAAVYIPSRKEDMGRALRRRKGRLYMMISCFLAAFSVAAQGILDFLWS